MAGKPWEAYARPVARPGIIGPGYDTKQRMNAADLEAKYIQMQKMQQDMERDRRTPIPQPAQARETPQEKARGVYLAKIAASTGDIEANMPRLEESARFALKAGANLIKHPGFGAAVGMPDPFRGGFGLFTVPGTTARGFNDRLAQLQGGAFLQAVQALKGSGPVTEIEGVKATAALSRMNAASSESEFKSALQDYLDSIAAGVRVARTQVKQGKAAIATGGAFTPSRSDIEREMRRRGLLPPKGK